MTWPFLVCGLNHDYDTESFDRLNMDIPYGQVELIQEVVKANPRTIVVMIAGSPLNMAAVDICSRLSFGLGSTAWKEEMPWWTYYPAR